MPRISKADPITPFRGRVKYPRINLLHAQPEKFAIGFADEISSLRDRLDIKAGEIEIPNGKNWLAREIHLFAQTLVDILFASDELRSLGPWKEDLAMGIKEALTNSFAHAGGAKVWVRWRRNEKALVVEIVDEGMNPFDINTRPSGRIVTDLIGDPLAGRGIGMGYITRSADEVEVLPVISGDQQLKGHRVVFTKYFTKFP